MIDADLIIKNGKILSVALDGSILRATAAAVKDGKILAVGSDNEIEQFKCDDTKIINCSGNSVLPGMCDAHCHPSISASAYSGCNLFGIYIRENETADEVIDKYMDCLKKFIEANPDDTLIRGTGWVMGNFTGGRVPTRYDIDRICSDRPVILESFCQHNLWVNSKAIEMAGVDKNTPDVSAGKIYRDANNEPLGVFTDPEAMALIKEHVPGYDFSVSKYKEAFMYYQKNYANKYGVTLVADCLHSENARQAYTELAREGKLTLRARGVYLLEPGKSEEQLPEYISRKGADDVCDAFRIDTIKIFAEGMFSLIEPYEKNFIAANNLPENYNEPLYWDDDEFVSAAAKAMKAGFNIHVHAMGDNAVRQSVHCLAKAQQKEGKKPRNIITHLMLIQEEDIKRMADAEIIANCQPRWMVYDSDIYAMIPMLGEKRAVNAYPLRKFLDENVLVSFGTDFPVTPPPNTMHEIQCAMTRSVFPDAPDYENFKGKILGSETPASLTEAVKAITINGAYQMFAEDITGSIEAGKSADFVILDSDIEETPAEHIYNIEVEETVFKGKVVYQRQRNDLLCERKS